MNHESLPETSLGGYELSRRGVLRAGGITLGLAALLAACAEETDDASPARVGSAPKPPTLPEGTKTDAVLFRTATSFHFSIIDAHNLAKEVGKLDADHTELVDAFIAAHQTAITDLQKWSTTAGGQPWTCANPRFDRVILTPIKDHITGRPKQGTEETDVPPSDDPNRDALALVHAMETLAGEMHQSLVPQFSKPEYRQAAMVHGQEASRRAAVMAITINPANLVNPASVESATLTTEAATTSSSVQDIGQTDESAPNVEAQNVINEPAVFYAISTQFGQLGPVQLAIGAPSAGTQFTINIETPSLNSFIYDYETEADCVGDKP